MRSRPEPSAELVDVVMLQVGRRLLEDAAARLSEITDEEWHRMISEEREALRSGFLEDVDDETFVNRVGERARARYGYMLEQRRRIL